MTNNKKWVIAISIVLIGIFSIIVYGMGQNADNNKIGGSINDIVDSADDGAKEFKEEVKDEIDDNTKNGR